MEEIRTTQNLYPELYELTDQAIPCVFATVINSMGSTPQKPGSSAIFNKEGLITGTIGGGRIEYEIQKLARDAVKNKISGFYHFDLNDDITEEDSVICGGGMSILLDASPGDHRLVLKSIKQSTLNREPGVLVTKLSQDKDEKIFLERTWITGNSYPALSEKFPALVNQSINEMLETKLRGDFRLPGSEQDTTRFILESVIPLPQLIIAGAGHVGRALSHLGRLLEFEVTVWDDRPELANKKYLPDAEKILTGDLENSLNTIKPGKDTYLVIVTRGHKNDADVLKLFIHSDFAYVGMMGSKTKVARVYDKFISEGWATQEEWKKIHTPIGLEIHSKTVQEIAVSIAAELIKVRSGQSEANG